MTYGKIKKVVYGGNNPKYIWKLDREVTFMFSCWIQMTSPGDAISHNVNLPAYPSAISSDVIRLCSAIPETEMSRWFSEYFNECAEIGMFVADPSTYMIYQVVDIYGCVKEPLTEYTKKYQEQIIYQKLQS
jgi:hypothetical protein